MSNPSNQPTRCTKSFFIISLLHASTCFEHYMFIIIKRSKFYYTASGIITPIGGRPVHRTLNMCTGNQLQSVTLTGAV